MPLIEINGVIHHKFSDEELKDIARRFKNYAEYRENNPLPYNERHATKSYFSGETDSHGSSLETLGSEGKQIFIEGFLG